MNFAANFFHCIDANQWHDLCAIKDDRVLLTYRELKDKILARVSAIQVMGLKPADGVILMRPDSAQYLVDFFAVLYLGGRVILLPTNCAPARLIHTMQTLNAKWMSTASASLQEITDHVRIFQAEESQSTSPADAAHIHDDEISLCLFSSGTSGKMPKSVLHRHRSLMCAIEILIDAYGSNTDNVIFSTAKLSFQYGLFNALYGLFTGATVVVTEHVPSPSRITAITQSNQVTHFFSTPTVLTSLINPVIPAQSLSSVQVLVSAGEHLLDSLESKLSHKFGKPVFNAIGMSEMIICVIGNSVNQHRAYTLGKPWKNIESKVVDEHENEVETGAVGELMILSPTCSVGYHDDAEATERAFKNGWFKTNDLVKKLDNQSITYVGRKNDCDKINGLFVSPLDVENAILQHDDIKECMVSIITGAREKKILVANVVCNDLVVELNQAKLREFLRQHLDTHMIPKIINQVKEIPTTATSKKMRCKVIVDQKDLANV